MTKDRLLCLKANSTSHTETHDHNIQLLMIQQHPSQLWGVTVIRNKYLYLYLYLFRIPLIHKRLHNLQDMELVIYVMYLKVKN